MKDSLSNRRKMHLATLAVLTEHRDVWSASSPTVNNFNIFSNLLSEFEKARLKQETPLRGITLDKKLARGKLSADMLHIIAGIKSFAADTDSNTLYESVHYTKSELDVIRENILLDRAKLVLATADRIKGEASAESRIAWDGYGLSGEELNRLRASVEEYEKITVKPTLAKNERKEATATLDSIAERIHDHLARRLDNNMEQFRREHPDFYAAYHDARIITDSGKAGTAIKGTIKDASTGVPIERVALEMTERGVTAFTNSDGIYHFKKLKPGRFTMKISAEGYEDKEMRVNITEGKTTDTDVELKRLPVS